MRCDARETNIQSRVVLEWLCCFKLEQSVTCNCEVITIIRLSHVNCSHSATRSKYSKTQKLKTNSIAGIIQGLVMQEYLKIMENQIYMCHTTYKPCKSLILEQLHSITKKMFLHASPMSCLVCTDMNLQFFGCNYFWH